MDNIFYRIKNIFSEEKKQKMLALANRPGAFFDNSYGISFYKHPLELDVLSIDGLWQVQMLKQSVRESKIHKDKNRQNEFDNIYMPRATVMSWPIQGEGYTCFYDENHQSCIATVNYNNDGAILNTGGHPHNVILTSDEPRIVFQLCFEESFETVVKYYEDHISSWTY